MDRYTAEVDKDFAFHEPDQNGMWVMYDDVQSAIDAAVAADRERWAGVEEYLVAAADGSMSRNNSENLAAELLAQVRGPNGADERAPRDGA